MVTRPVKRLVKAKPIMNTQEELRHAFEQLDGGTFLRPDAPR